MKRSVAAFDRWLARAPVTELDLSIFRILYATYVLVAPWRVEFALELPDIAWDPPWGPFRLITSPPPAEFTSAVSGILAISLAFLLVGWFTRFNSILVFTAQVVLYGIGYSYGKIDHTILLPLVPLFLAWSGWGNRLSMDSLRARAPISFGWPVRLLAVSIGLAYLTAAIPKVRAGWLDLESQATRGHFIAQYFDGRETVLSGLAKAVAWPPIWEALDWLTIALEAGLVIAALHWGAFRIALAFATVFHLGILLTLGIAFYPNIVAFGAFVSWYVVLGRPGRLRIPESLRKWLERGWPVVLLALGLGAASWALGTLAPFTFVSAVRQTLIVAAGAGGAAYLISRMLDAVAAIRRRRT